VIDVSNVLCDNDVDPCERGAQSLREESDVQTVSCKIGQKKEQKKRQDSQLDFIACDIEKGGCRG